MEKIIAVVVMIAIVVGLIATAVLPMVNQMNEQGANANDQLNILSAGLEDGQVTGSMIYSDFTVNKSKIVETTPDSVAGTLTFVVNDESGNELFDGFNNDLATLKTKVAETEIYSKTETLHPSGKVATVVYQRIALN